MELNVVEHPTKALAEFVANTSYSDLADEVVHEAKRLILDNVGCALGGYMTDIGAIAINVQRTLGGKPEATIIGSGDKTSCVEAARVNSRMGHALDADETFPTVAHHGNAIVNSALAACERAQASGKDLISCVAIGYELGARMGVALMDSPKYDRERRDYVGSRMGSGHLMEVVGGTSATAKALRLSSQQIARAYGIACLNIPVGQVSQRRSVTLYDCKAPDSAMVGIMAVLYAQMGMTSDEEVLDGEFGAWRMTGADKCDFALMAGGLGERWHLLDITYKPWPCCRFIHSALTAFISILEENDLKPEEIEKVLALVHVPLAVQPRFTNQNPVGLVNHEFSIPYAFAMAALRVTPGPGWYVPEMVNDARAQEFSQKVTVELDPKPVELIQRIKGIPYTRWPAGVEVKARGKTYQAFAEYARGDPWSDQTYFTDDELKAKFRNFATPIGGASTQWQGQIETVIDMVYNLENVEQIVDLTRLLSR